jgi:hypothetical protein
MKTNFKRLIICLIVFVCGILIGCHKDDYSFVNTLNASIPEEYINVSMSPSPVPAPSVSYQRMNAYGKYYLVFTTPQGGIFVIKE